MIEEHQIRETIELCVLVMNRHHDAPRSRQSTELMIAEVQAIAAWLHRCKLGVQEIDDLVINPVLARLTDRYGHELGTRLAAKFLDIFDSYQLTEQLLLRHRDDF